VAFARHGPFLRVSLRKLRQSTAARLFLVPVVWLEEPAGRP